MIVYKVVRRASPLKEEIVWKSAVMTRAGCVEYVLGEWAQAPDWLREFGYHLLAFRTLSDARGFATVENEPLAGHCIFKSEAEVMPIYPAPMNVWNIDAKGGFLKRDLSTNDWPPGTVMCRRIKLLEEIEI